MAEDRGSVAGVRGRRWVLVVGSVLFFWNLWGYDLWAPDEPYFGEGAREMLVDGEWVVPHVNGQISTDKQALFFWLIALVSLPFGAVSSFTARLPSALAALGTVALTMAMGRRMAGPRPAALAGALLVTTHMFWDKARWVQIDSVLCFLETLALYHFYLFRSGAMSGRRAGIGFWVSAAFAALAKGPVGVLVPLGIALTTLAADRSLGAWRRFAPFAGPAGFVALATAWIAVVTIWGGEYSVVAAFREHVLDRAIHGMHHVQPPWYYLYVLPYLLLPWSLLIPGALVLAWRRRKHADDRFLLVYFLFVVVFFSVPTEKRDLYVLPALPAFALLASRLVAAVAGLWPEVSAQNGTLPDRRWVTIPHALIGAGLAVGAVAASLLAPRFGSELVGPAAALSVTLGVGGVAVLLAACRRLPLPAVRRTGVTMAAAMIVAVTFVYPALNPQKSERALAVIVQEQTAESRASGQQVLGFDVGYVTRGISFYSNGIYLRDISDPEELLASLSSDKEVFLVGNEKTLPEFPEAVRQRMTVLYRTRLSRKDLAFLRFEPLGPSRAP